MPAYVFYIALHASCRCTALFNGLDVRDQNGSTRRLRGILVSFKGDWKWKVQALHLTRHYNCSMVCHLCMATKGPPFAFEDLDIRSATWLQSIGAVLPWEGDPPATQIPGFTVETDRWDLLHVFHLGVGRLTAGSAIVVALINCFALYGDCGWLHAKLCIVLISQLAILISCTPSNSRSDVCSNSDSHSNAPSTSN